MAEFFLALIVILRICRAVAICMARLCVTQECVTYENMVGQAFLPDSLGGVPDSLWEDISAGDSDWYSGRDSSPLPLRRAQGAGFGM